MNQTIVVTGGTKGIGKAIVMQAAERGMDIITCARSAADLDEIKRTIEGDKKVTVHTLQTDLSLKQEVALFTSFVQKHTTDLTILVNNAGIFIPGQIHSEEEGVLESMIQTNVYSAYYLTRGILSLMKKGSHIFNMCSTASFVPYVNGGSYCISKYALLGFSRVLREELKERGIRVTALMPGATLTASWEGVDIPEERFMKAEDVSEAVFSAFDLSSRTVIEEIILRPQLGDL